MLISLLKFFFLRLFLFVARNRVPSRWWDFHACRTCRFLCGCICRDMDFELSSALSLHLYGIFVAGWRPPEAVLYQGLDVCIRGIMCFLLFLSAGMLGATLYGKFIFYFYVKLDWVTGWMGEFGMVTGLKEDQQISFALHTVEYRKDSLDCFQ